MFLFGAEPFPLQSCLQRSYSDGKDENDPSRKV